jgi:membrane fusion protein, heavy metal efflux system
MNKHYLALAVLALIVGCADRRESHSDEHGHGDEPAEAEFDRGPHDGRLLTRDDFAVELSVFEAGVPPEFRIWLYENEQALPPTAATVTVKLTRLDGETNTFDFRPEGDFLRSDGVVHEPHSFDVEVTAQRQGGARAQWKFASYEGRTRIAAATAHAMGVNTKVAAPATLEEQLTLSGTVHPDPSRVSRVRARYAGVVREVLVQPAGHVRKGAVLAQVQSNESLQNYPLTAPISGTVVEHRAQIGEATGDEALFVIIDTSSVWVELDLFQGDLSRVREGQRVELLDLDGRLVASGAIGRLAPLAAHGSQSVRARVVVDNASGALRPGQFVTGRVTLSSYTVPLAVERVAIQRYKDFDAVFERIGDRYEVRMLELGRADATHVEVLGGLKASAQYVVDNSYLIKADIEKSGASHDH